MTRRWVRVVQVTVPPDEARDAVRRHRDVLAAWRREGVLVASYAFEGGDGFVDVYRAPDRLEAQARAEDSPLVAEGLAGWFVRPLDGDGEA